MDTIYWTLWILSRFVIAYRVGVIFPFSPLCQITDTFFLTSALQKHFYRRKLVSLMHNFFVCKIFFSINNIRYNKSNSLKNWLELYKNNLLIERTKLKSQFDLHQYLQLGKLKNKTIQSCFENLSLSVLYGLIERIPKFQNKNHAWFLRDFSIK